MDAPAVHTSSAPTRRFDVVIVGAGGSGMQASLQLARAGLNVAVLVEGVPDPLAHRRGAGRHRRLARQHERGQLALPLLRHRQGQRLARRPGRDRVHVPRGAERRLRARALRHAVRPQPRRHDLPAPVRRPHRELRREAGAARLRRGRPHRPRDAAHALPAERQGAHQFLRRVDGARPDPRRRGRRRRRHRARDGDRPAAHPAGQGGDARDRRRRPDLRGVDQRLHQHRRRPRHGGARRPAARGHGVLAVPPDRRRTAPACCSPKAAAARARSCATATASASWSATRRR